MAQILFTQDGVQLVPASEEIRAGYDQLSGELEIVSNTKWTVSKASEGDDWFTIVNPAGEGDGKIQLTFTQNDEEEVSPTKPAARKGFWQVAWHLEVPL